MAYLSTPGLTSHTQLRVHKQNQRIQVTSETAYKPTRQRHKQTAKQVLLSERRHPSHSRAARVQLQPCATSTDRLDNSVAPTASATSAAVAIAPLVSLAPVQWALLAYAPSLSRSLAWRRRLLSFVRKIVQSVQVQTHTETLLLA